MHGDSYFSYLLRLWRVVQDGQPVWQASLESTRTGERLNFGLEELVAFLQAHFGPPEPGQPEERGRR
jgi:hypothetical protein